MPSYVFKRPPTAIADYKVIEDGDKYTFFGNSVASASMGTIINYSVASAIINQATSWTSIPEATYDSKRETVLTSLELRPDQIFPSVSSILNPLSYFFYELPFGGGITYFAILTGETGFDTSFSEAVTYNEMTLEYTILRNFSEPYNNALLAFLQGDGKKSSPKEYNFYRDQTYRSIQSDGRDGEVVLPPLDLG